ncbi:hypothetical protein BSL82_04410 [Tardibacter chloracetimidivorans]|uniref:SnoaL-like domain-containing protein n=1 Tax=Tardibacter chloracetimidivorans TaxID=1921510 RepID=A0A1L3ZSP6_9SPHN|nr:nuclear transport factor 2 family protein [Tardibacter chloracetimidivorans]API58647.1 hypothetical protein BSL82_04410 [Tardibacter chloracetimidivorans]
MLEQTEGIAITLSDIASMEAIHLIKARYCRYCDTGQPGELADLFSENAIFDVRAAASIEPPTDGVFAEIGYQVGRKNIRDTIALMLSNLSSSVHHCHMPEIELTSPTTAKAIWAMEDRIQLRTGPIKSMHGFGHYHETYIIEDATWRIETLRLTRLRVDIVPAE